MEEIKKYNTIHIEILTRKYSIFDHSYEYVNEVYAIFKYITFGHFYQICEYSVDDNLRASDNVIWFNDPSTEMLTSQS